MAADISFLGPIIGSVGKVIFYVLIGFVILIAVFIFGRLYKTKKAYNIPVTIWIPRSDNKIVDELSAKGGYFNTGGVASFRLKRKKLKEIEIEPPASRFLVGLSRHLYLVQKGMDDFEPVLPESFMTVETQQRNKEGKFIRKAVVNLKCVNQDSTAWRFDNEANAKKRFTFHNLWEKYKDFIQITIFILVIMIGVYIQWKGLSDVAVQLKQVAEALQPAISNSPIVS